jgi:hypothetical protein
VRGQREFRVNFLHAFEGPAQSGGDLGSVGASPRVRQNLALVVGLQGCQAEAETIVKADQPAGEAAANVTFLKRPLSKDSTRADAGSTKAAVGGRPE